MLWLTDIENNGMGNQSAELPVFPTTNIVLSRPDMRVEVLGYSIKRDLLQVSKIIVMVMRLNRGAAADACSGSLTVSVASGSRDPPNAVLDALSCSAKAN